ncbi:S8 family peptidase [Desulforegula conservatrix]|uniref:S8 family peptidase n=1 Tax=Desulforegula conservatrix TaxID=153026 RepID=UPI00042A70E2|nr:S8 family serine peptidase [Desulforegula conservatrix]
MKLLKIILSAIAVILLFAFSVEASENLYSGIVPDHYIVVLNDNIDKSLPETANEMARIHGLGIGHIYTHALKGFSAYIPEQRLEKLRSDPRVSFIDPDRLIHASGSFEAKAKPGPAPPPAGQVLPTGIKRINADLNTTLRPVDIDVAVLDTGIDLDHPDLNVSIERSVTFIRTRTGADDDNGHGTHVAGIIGAKDNDIGVVGVAPGARLWAVKVLDKNGSGTWSGVIAGIDWVTARAGIIKVANMSLSGTGTDTDSTLRQAIDNSVAAGITYAVAAGNESTDAKNSVPAAYKSVITVSAIADSNGQPGGGGPDTYYGPDDTFATFSNYGADVDIAAPGVSINSTWKGGGYKIISGTSMAAPHVAGAAALYIDNNPGLSPADVKAALINHGIDQGETGGFTGDPDNYHEPLLNAAGL